MIRCYKWADFGELEPDGRMLRCHDGPDGFEEQTIGGEVGEWKGCRWVLLEDYQAAAEGLRERLTSGRNEILRNMRAAEASIQSREEKLAAVIEDLMSAKSRVASLGDAVHLAHTEIARLKEAATSAEVQREKLTDLVEKLVVEKRILTKERDIYKGIAVSWADEDHADWCCSFQGGSCSCGHAEAKDIESEIEGIVLLREEGNDV